MQNSLSWRNAFFLSTMIHLFLIGGFIIFLSWEATKPIEHYVIDMDLTQGTMQGGGHAGGNSAGSAAEMLFPKPLSEESVSQRLEQVKEMSSVLSPQGKTDPLPHMNEIVNSNDSTSNTTSNLPNNSNQTSGRATGTGEGANGVADTGTGSGSGDGNTNGNGLGQESGVGNGQGSGDANVSGTGSQPFDVDGFWAAVEAQKQYPAAAVKRRLTGSVTIVTMIAADGSCIGVDVSSSSGYSILDEAARAAARAACPYPNPTGGTVPVTTVVSFDGQ